MSLTSHLDNKDSAVRRHIAATFGHTRDARYSDLDEPATAVTVDGATLPVTPARRFTAGPAHLLPTSSDNYPWGTAGTAFDYRLRLLLDRGTPAETVAALERSPAAAGARLLGTHGGRPRAGRTGGSPGRGWQETLSAVADHLAAARRGTGGPHERLGEQVDDLALSRLCGVLALYEQLYRIGPSHQAWSRSPLVAGGPDADLDSLRKLVDARLPADVAAMTCLAGQQPGLQDVSNIEAGATFARSADLGGADADLLLDGLLLEVKTVQNAALTQLLLWQVLGYVLADTGDTHRIRRVGFYFARHGIWWEMPVAEYLRRLAGREVDLARERERFTMACVA